MFSKQARIPPPLSLTPDSLEIHEKEAHFPYSTLYPYLTHTQNPLHAQDTLVHSLSTSPSFSPLPFLFFSSLLFSLDRPTPAYLPHLTSLYPKLKQDKTRQDVSTRYIHIFDKVPFQCLIPFPFSIPVVRYDTCLLPTQLIQQSFYACIRTYLYTYIHVQSMPTYLPTKVVRVGRERSGRSYSPPPPLPLSLLPQIHALVYLHTHFPHLRDKKYR